MSALPPKKDNWPVGQVGWTAYVAVRPNTWGYSGPRVENFVCGPTTD
jgi:hypothetical protein